MCAVTKRENILLRWSLDRPVSQREHLFSLTFVAVGVRGQQGKLFFRLQKRKQGFILLAEDLTMHSGAVGHEWPVAASERPLSIAESCSRSGRSSGCAVGSAFGAQLGCDASSTQLTSIVGVMDASLQPPRPRSASESSIDSGVTACEGTDLLHHARQLRRMADERIASARDNRCRPSTESAPADIASTSPPSYLRTRKLNLDLPESSRQQQSIDSSSHRPHRPRSQSTGTPMRHTATMTPRDNVILLAKKDSAMPDLSPAAAQHRSMRRRKQAVDEAFIWIRKQLVSFISYEGR